MAEDRDLKVWVDGRVRSRDEARVSVFDSGFQSGDAVWEGLRVYAGAVHRLDEHLDRLEASAGAVAISLPYSRQEIGAAVFDTLAANPGFDDGVHIRLMVTRGERKTSGMDPRNSTRATMAVIAERKPVEELPTPQRLRTASIRRPSPQVLDPTIHHANQLNSILARLEAQGVGADAALMLDESGFVAEADTANLMIVRQGRVVTPWPRACIHGITRGTVLELAASLGIVVEERDLSLFDVYSAEEVFLTGTVCELVSVCEVDGRPIGGGGVGPVYGRLLGAYRQLVQEEVAQWHRSRSSGASSATATASSVPAAAQSGR
ncbi:MAG TPA: aminotransferase class IV [Candidatus Saccharimonadales bacterium]|nr:aminotransferase class IV [Candidatus Saccharimonadales bacterium]